MLVASRGSTTPVPGFHSTKPSTFTNGGSVNSTCEVKSVKLTTVIPTQLGGGVATNESEHARTSAPAATAMFRL